MNSSNTQNVYLISCATYDPEVIYHALLKSLAGLGLDSGFIKRDDSVMIKPNLLYSSDPERGIITHPAVMEAVCRWLSDTGARIKIGDSCGMGSAVSALKRAGMQPVLARYGVKAVDFSKPQVVKMQSSARYKNIELAGEVMECDYVINLPKVKAHGQMGMTLAVKNLFGCVVGTAKTRWHFMVGDDVLCFARLLLDICRRIAPVLTFADGIMSMEGNGPGNGRPKSTGFLVVSQDCLAVDLVISQLVGMRLENNPVIVEARNMNESGAWPQNVNVLGAPVRELSVRNFEIPNVVPVGSSLRILRFARRFLKNSFAIKPAVITNKCTLCLTCIRKCPVHCIRQQKKNIKIIDKKCIRCFCCQEICPQGAIFVKKGFLLKVAQKIGLS